MSRSYYVIGFAPPDARWKKMKKIWDACQEAGINPSEEVLQFFDHQDPDPAGVEREVPCHEWYDDDRGGYEVNVEDIPKEVKILRFVIS